MSKPCSIFSVHDQEVDGLRAIVGMRLSEDEAKALADEVFAAEVTSEVWVEEWTTDGYWYDSTVIYSKKRS